MIDISLYLSVSCIKEFLKGVAIFLCPFITTLCYIRKLDGKQRMLPVIEVSVVYKFSQTA